MKGTVKENTDFEKTLKVGIIEVVPLVVNPTREEIIKLYNIPEENQERVKEKEYIGTTEEGDAKLKIVIYCKAIHSEAIHLVSFTLINKDRLNKDGSKMQILNQSGITSWIEMVNDKPDTDRLAEWFTNFQKVNEWTYTDGEKGSTYKAGAKATKTINLDKKTYRPAKEGEEKLVEFCKNWLNTWNINNPETDYFLDTKKLFNGNVSELNLLIKNKEGGSIMIVLCVKTKEDIETGEVKEYQSVFNRVFLPGTLAKQINLNAFNDRGQQVWDKFKKNFEGEYAPKDFFSLLPVHDYDPSKNIATAITTNVTDDSPDY